MKYPFIVQRQNCFGTKDQDRNWEGEGGGGGGSVSFTLFEKWGYILMEQLFSVFRYIVRQTTGFPFKHIRTWFLRACESGGGGGGSVFHCALVKFDPDNLGQ